MKVYGVFYYRTDYEFGDNSDLKLLAETLPTAEEYVLERLHEIYDGLRRAYNDRYIPHAMISGAKVMSFEELYGDEYNLDLLSAEKLPAPTCIGDYGREYLYYENEHGSNAYHIRDLELVAYTRNYTAFTLSRLHL